MQDSSVSKISVLLRRWIFRPLNFKHKKKTYNSTVRKPLSIEVFGTGEIGPQLEVVFFVRITKYWSGRFNYFKCH